MGGAGNGRGWKRRLPLEAQEDLEPGSLIDTVRAYNADLAKSAVRAGRATKRVSSKAKKVSGKANPSEGARVNGAESELLNPIESD